jgi:membrane protein DedA with SNARE-associated domain
MEALFGQLQHAWHTLHAGDYQMFGAWAYVIIVLLVMTEGSITTLVGASAAAAGFLDVRLVLVATIVGNVTGDVLWYMVGYTGGIERAQRIAQRVGIDGIHLETMCHKLQDHAAKAILLAKAALGLIIPTLLAAGLARVHLRRWFPVVFLVETVWSVLLVFVGFHTADAVARTESGLKAFGLIMLVLVVAFFVKRRHAGQPGILQEAGTVRKSALADLQR